MIRVKLYEEIIEDGLIFVKCNKSDLKNQLASIIRGKDDIDGQLIVQAAGEDCMIYIKNEKGTNTVKVDPAARIRLETGFEELDYDFARIDEALAGQGIDANKEKVCKIRQLDLDDDFIIMDVYVAM